MAAVAAGKLLKSDGGWFSEELKESSRFSSSTEIFRKTTFLGPIKTPESISSMRYEEAISTSLPVSVNSNPQLPDDAWKMEIALNDGLGGNSSVVDTSLSEDEREQIRISQVHKKKDFVYIDRTNGIKINAIQGIELYTRVFNAEEQKRIAGCVYHWQQMAKIGMPRAWTYPEPRKWMRGPGCVTMQFGCCYYYAVDKLPNPPKLIWKQEVHPLPTLFKNMIRRLVRWNILPPSHFPNTCIVNIFGEGDCSNPHIDHHDFLRRFCTVSVLTDCNVNSGSSSKVMASGQFSSLASTLPKGSVLILDGSAADVAEHCFHPLPAKRISITFMKLEKSNAT